MPQTALVTPVCCKAVEESGAVFLLYDLDDLRDGTYLHKPPHWATYALNLDTGNYDAVLASYCPHCGTELPNLQKKRLGRSKVCEIAEDKKSCKTCAKGWGQCVCWPPEYAWEPANTTVKFHRRF